MSKDSYFTGQQYKKILLSGKTSKNIKFLPEVL